MFIINLIFFAAVIFAGIWGIYWFWVLAIHAVSGPTKLAEWLDKPPTPYNYSKEELYDDTFQKDRWPNTYKKLY